MNNPDTDIYGNKRWFNHIGQLHRDNGPAIEYANGSKVWIKNGKCHRINGPAIQYANGHKEYWINDKMYSSLEAYQMDLALE